MTPVAVHQDDGVLLVRASAHLHSRSEVLTDFEAATIREAFDRVILSDGVMSAAEREVVVAALEAMVLAPRQDLTDVGLAA